ncbi:MAG: class I SAM-dependent methyltransferase [Myxococcales bacterium]|nr:class I SAM-dependent methyltransferase [Myxococcales bacterium]
MSVSIDVPDTLAAYDRWATHYDHDDNPLVAATGWVLAHAPLPVAGARVVELGCGTGRHAAPVLAAGAVAYLGVDGSAGMLAQAQARVADPRAAWLTADLAALPPCPGPRFDRALIALVLEHVAAPAPLFAALAGWLAPGATLRILELHPERISAGTAAHFVDGGVEHRFASFAHDPAALIADLAAAGFAATAQAWCAEGALLAAVPRLAKHAGRPVVLDITATRGA